MSEVQPKKKKKKGPHNYTPKKGPDAMSFRAKGSGWSRNR